MKRIASIMCLLLLVFVSGCASTSQLPARAMFQVEPQLQGFAVDESSRTQRFGTAFEAAITKPSAEQGSRAWS